MTAYPRIVRKHIDGTSVISDVELNQGGDGFYLARNGWIPAVAGRSENGEWERVVTESMTLHAEGSSTNDLAANVRALNTILRMAGDFASEPLGQEPVYLQDKLDLMI